MAEIVIKIVKNDDFKTIGIDIREERTNTQLFSYGIAPIDVYFVKTIDGTSKMPVIVKLIELRTRLNAWNNFIYDLFEVANENKIKTNGLKFTKMEDEKNKIEKEIEKIVMSLK